MTYKPAFPKPPKRKRKAPAKVTQPEALLQEMSEQLLAIYDIPYFRLSDTLMRALFANPQIPLHIKKILSDQLKGFPDLVLFDKCTRHYRAIEIKTERGKLSHAQRRWEKLLGTHVCRGLEEIKTCIESFREEVEHE